MIRDIIERAARRARTDSLELHDRELLQAISAVMTATVTQDHATLERTTTYKIVDVPILRITESTFDSVRVDRLYA